MDALRSDRHLREGRAQLVAIIESLDDPALGKALDGTIQSWNPAAERLYGYRAEEVVGKPISVLAPPERATEIDGILARLRRGEVITEYETVRRRKDGTDVRVSLSISPVRGTSGEIVGASAIAHDIGDRLRREEIQSFLTEASRLFAVNLDYRETLSRVANLMLSSLAEWCMVETADPDGSLTQVAVAHREPAKAELARQMRRRFPPGAERPDIPLRVLATGRAELVPEVSDALLKNIAQSEEHLSMLRELAPRSLIVVPLRARERVLGTILLANAESGQRFGADDLGFAEDLARRAALAIDNAMLHKSEQEARRRAERAAERLGKLQAVTAALSAAVTPTAVGDIIVGQGAAAIGAEGGFVRLLTANGRGLELLATMGASKHFARAYGTLPLASALPDAEVFRTGAERYFESDAAVRAASPDLARELSASGHRAIAIAPLHGLQGPIGVMTLSFAAPRRFDGDDRELLKALAGQCSHALERARLYEAERQARAEAELAIERTTRLQLLAAELAEALTPAQVAEIVVAQGIASIEADAGALQLLSSDGKILEVVNGQGSNRALIESGWRRFSADLPVPSADALHRLEPVFIESRKDIRQNYGDMFSTKGASRVRAGAHIPLVVSGRAVGVLFLGYIRPRRFSSAQRSFVLALGRQCAQALQRAQLYEAELDERRRLELLVERLHEGVVSVDRGGRVEFASSKALQMLRAASLQEGRKVPKEWLGFPLRDYVTALFAADESVVEAQVVSPDGERVFDVTGIPPGRSDSVLLVVTDASERVRRHRAEREFVDNAAHELRTPLAAITSAIERLQAGAREIPEKRDRFLGYIQTESVRLNRLASSLLVLARAQTREEEPRREQIKLRGLLEDLISGFELNQGVELVLECPPDLVARSNRDLLEHALLNLASNAARHTDVGRVRFSACAGTNGSVRIEVSDTGAGIAPDVVSRLFDRFYRGPNEDGHAGFGLGLPIVKESVEAIGGRITIDSVLGEGTTARIVLPCVDAPAAA